MPSLTLLDVSDNKMGGAGVKSIIRAVGNCVGLKHLNLSHIGSPGEWDAETTTAVAELMGKLPSIAHLNLAGNFMHNLGRIAGALGLCVQLIR